MAWLLLQLGVHQLLGIGILRVLQHLVDREVTLRAPAAGDAGAMGINLIPEEESEFDVAK